MRLLIFLLVLVSSCFGCVFDDKGEPKKALVTILDIFYIPHNGQASSIFEGMRPLLRKDGIAQKDLSEKKLTYEQKSILLSSLTDLGFIDAVKPQKMEYDDVLVLGSYAGEIRNRMEYLIDLYNQGLRFKRIFFLTGERYRDLGYEPDRVVFFSNRVPHCAADVETEAGIMRTLWLQLDKPKELAEMKPIIIDAPETLIKKGKKRAPNTYDTVIALLQGSHECHDREWIAISSQPFVSYQAALLKRVMPPSYTGVTVGPEAGRSVLFSQYLDTLARAVHNEYWTRHPECPPIN